MMTVLEEYCTAAPEGRLTQYRGSRTLEVPDDTKVGAQYGETVTLTEPVTIYKGGVDRKPVSLPEGTRVWRWKTDLGLKPRAATT